MDALYLALSAASGCLVASFLGWLSSGENFIARKFLASFLRTIASGGIFATASTLVSGVATWENLVVAFLAGAGIDVVGHRIAGSIRVGT